MKCPYCGCDMVKGELHSRGGLYFHPEGEGHPKFYTESQMEKHHCIYLPPYLLEKAEYPTAYACKACSKIIITY